MHHKMQTIQEYLSGGVQYSFCDFYLLYKGGKIWNSRIVEDPEINSVVQVFGQSYQIFIF